ncbi:hypothetical protein N7478_011262 [Penicillium angulare]|uniref:uncharacterized protein n=1 Tax=Penicillium angulare TaxID=116970 RepID=UPI0025425D1E|nr:uncharacterized protein N7478_011262 [Penicillium angulare]KAJ5263657.1 hypothetical protein N7478_011262 [Penicillium angulare]
MSQLKVGSFDSEQMVNKDLALGPFGIYQHFATNPLIDDHEIVFTHSVFATRNILADDNWKVTAILDWSWPGYYLEC